MEITGLGIKIVEQLVEAELINDVADIYNLTKSSLLELEGFAEKKAENLFEAIDISKKKPLSRLIYALGIRGVGEVMAIELAKHFTDLDRLSCASENDLQEIEGIGPNIALAVVDWFGRETNRQLLNKLCKAGVWPEEKGISQQLNSAELFSDMTFVITGAINGYTREELKEIIQQNGGKVSDSVSKNTNYLLVGEQPGSKLEKAKNIGVKIIDIQELNILLDKVN